VEQDLSNAKPLIRMGEMATGTAGDVLQTLLGSCIGVALYDRKRKIGGLAHIVLPKSRRVDDPPGKCADLAIPRLISMLESDADGAIRLSAKLAGGAKMLSSSKTADIGEQNQRACEQLLRELRIPILARDCGGNQGRRISFDVSTGIITIKIVGRDDLNL
jgi:chemotaxis protein CheD